MRDVYKALQEDDPKFLGFDTKYAIQHCVQLLILCTIVHCLVYELYICLLYYYLKRFINKHNQDVISGTVSEASNLDTESPPFIQLRGTCIIIIMNFI